ncbi:Protein phosphatase 1L [Halotydeus destructor]|nr:Protein phosphatase 1L [Halotydeus destructor]
MPSNSVKRSHSNVGDILELKHNSIGGYGIRGRRGTMEDRMSFVDETETLGIQFYGVFDGHGGDAAAEFVNEKLFKTIISRLNRQSAETKSSLDTSNCDKILLDEEKDFEQQTCTKLDLSLLSQILIDEVVALDSDLISELKKSYNLAGTTALFAARYLPENKLLIANVGDSRGVLCNQRGLAVPLSTDHKPQSPKELKRIKEAGGFIKFTGVWRVGGILATSRAMGDYPLKDKKFLIAEPDVLVVDLNTVQPQFAIFATDGLWDAMTNEEAVEYVKETLATLKKRQTKKEDLAIEAAKAICYEAYRRLSVDNVTAIIVLFDSSDFSRRAGYTPSMSTSSRRKPPVPQADSRTVT